MKKSAKGSPTATRRQSASADTKRVRVRDAASLPHSRHRSDKTLPGDRSAREQESTTQGSE